MIEATSVQLVAGVDVRAYLFQLDRTTWICLLHSSAAEGRGWLECWSSKDEAAPDVPAALKAVRAIVAANMSHGPFGPYLKGAHSIPGWNVWGGANPGPIAHCRPADVVEHSKDSVDLAQYLHQLESDANG